MSSSLLSVCLLERDIVSWVYPEQSNDLRDLVLALHGAVGKSEPFFVGKLADAWFYVRRSDGFALAIASSDFNPAKYDALLALQCRRYAASNDVVGAVLQPFLQVFLSASVGDEWRESSFDYREALLAGSLRRLVDRFGADDVVRLWAAMLCKRRILVVGTGDCAELFGLVRSLPLLSFHRQNFGVLRPLVLLDNATQLAELKQLGAAYVAGVLNAPTSPALANALADVVVDVGARRVRGGDAELSGFEQALSSMLSEMASDTQQDDAAMVKALMVKTKALIARIASISSAGGREAIRTSEALPDDLKTLCVAIAQAENV
jgi:hypothetical protein